MKNLSYNHFWQQIHRIARSKGFPLRVMFELTYRCNFHCKHCYVPYNYRKKGELKTKEVFSVLDELKNIGCFYLGFTGGEPFIREDIMQILWYAKRKGFEVIIYTNGSLIDKTIAEELKRIRVNKADITIPAMRKAAFERISGVSGSREKVFAAINLLRENKVALGFKTCVLKENESEIKDIRNFAYSLGVLHRLDGILSPRLDGSEEPFKYRGKLSEKIATDQKSHVSENKHRLTGKRDFTDCNSGSDNREPTTENLFRCGVGVSQAAITPQGELKPCLMLDYPRLKILHTKNQEPNTDYQKLKEAWERLKEVVSSIKPYKNYKCKRCNLQAYYKWCPASGWLYNKNFTSCEPGSRKNARNTIQNLQFEDA